MVSAFLWIAAGALRRANMRSYWVRYRASRYLSAWRRQRIKLRSS